MCGPATAAKGVSLQAGEAARVMIRLLDRKKTKVEGDRQLLRVNAKVAVTDSWGNPVANDGFTVSVDGSEPYPFSTDERGLSNLEVDTALDGGNIVVTHPKVGSVPLHIDPLP
jgi:hypothetical protein